jgi:hypothetical protein
MKVKYLPCVVLITVLYGGCVEKTDANNKNPVAENNKPAEEPNFAITYPAEAEPEGSTPASEPVDAKPYIQLEIIDGVPLTEGRIGRRELNAAGIWEPLDSLREIA